MIENENNSSAEYRKTAHDGEFIFRNKVGDEHSLSHEEFKKELEKQRDELLRQIYGSDDSSNNLDDIPRKSR